MCRLSAADIVIENDWTIAYEILSQIQVAIWEPGSVVEGDDGLRQERNCRPTPVNLPCLGDPTLYLMGLKPRRESTGLSQREEGGERWV